MSLRALAESDLGLIMEDADGGFGWAVTLTNPAGTSEPMTGLSTDISQMIDPETGMLITGRSATVSLRLSSIPVAMGEPEGVPDADAKPWTVEFNDIGGTSHLFKISSAQPDRAIGTIVLVLEVYAL